RCNTLCAMTARYRIHHGPMSLSAGSGEGLSQRIPPPPRGAPGAEQANVSADRCHVPHHLPRHTRTVGIAGVALA
ncbi:MAG: hypothetical protein ACRDQ9_16890, partial [Pseudonocardiaceae bacterium]